MADLWVNFWVFWAVRDGGWTARAGLLDGDWVCEGCGCLDGLFRGVYLGLNIIYLAKQCGIGTFIGTAGNITGYAVDGTGLLRLKARFDKRVWRTSPRWSGQRRAAELFSAASAISSGLWAGLPAGMKRLCDAGAFNRLVGTMRILVEEGDQFRDQSAEVRVARCAFVGDVDGLRGLDLSLDAGGPHRVVKSDQGKVKSGDGGDSVGRVWHRDPSTPPRSTIGTPVGMTTYRLTGMDDLFREMDSTIGDGGGRKAGSYLVGQRFYGGKLISEPTDATMGSLLGWGLACARLRVEQGFDVGELVAYYGGWEFGKDVKAAGGWRVPGSVLRVVDEVRIDFGNDCLWGGLSSLWGAGNRVFFGLGRGRDWEGIRLHLPEWEERLRVCGYTRAWAARLGGWSALEGQGAWGKWQAVQPVRRFRVWAHVVELGQCVWRRGRYALDDHERSECGFVTDWVVCSGDALAKYPVEGKLDLQGGNRVFVVFTGIEVAELRGRHWVRLPWCCKVRVQEVVEAADFIGSQEVDVIGTGCSDASLELIPCRGDLGRGELGCGAERVASKAVLMGSGIRAGP